LESKNQSIEHQSSFSSIIIINEEKNQNFIHYDLSFCTATTTVLIDLRAVKMKTQTQNNSLTGVSNL